MPLPRLGVIVGSTRRGRFSERPAAWIAELARDSFEVDLLDLRDHPLPFFEEETSPARAAPQNPAARAWGARIAACDAFVATVAEYNHGATAVLKNAFDYAYAEWNKKPIGFVAYGGVGGARAVEHLRLVVIELQMAPIRTAVHLQMADFMSVMQGKAALSDLPHIVQSGKDMLSQLRWWSDALKLAREDAA